jgi:hypothetical protein
MMIKAKGDSTYLIESESDPSKNRSRIRLGAAPNPLMP